MADQVFELKDAVYTQRWTALARADVRLSVIGSWDTRLPRNRRILVPVDVQAFVVAAQDGEATVTVGGTRTDPEPFADPQTRPSGIHLHWAMPDALLRGAHDPATASLRLPALPDRWVVVRALLPDGGRVAHIAGWVVDAVQGTTTPLDVYAGTPTPGDPLVPLDGSSGGSLLWSATYEGAKGRFTLHDPLDDLAELGPVAPQGFHGGRAVYAVAGWWSDAASDPLAGCVGPTALDRVLARLGWCVSPDGEDALQEPPDERESRLRDQLGMDSPKTPPTTLVTKYATAPVRYADVQPFVTSPVEHVAATIIGPGATRYHCLLHGTVLGVPIDGTARGHDERPDEASMGGSIGLDVDDVAAALAAPAFGLASDPGLTDAQRRDRRQSAERLFAAFTGDLLSDLGSPDGIADLEAREHADTFWSFAGAPLPAARADVLRTQDTTALGPTAVGRKGRGARADGGLGDISTARLEWDHGLRGLRASSAGAASKRAGYTETSTSAERPGPAPGAESRAESESRSVTRPAPRLFRPGPVQVALRGAKPNNRLHGDGLHEDGALLRCRYPGEAVTAIDGVVTGAAIVPTIGSGAVPAEVLTVVREAVLLDGYAHDWLARAGADPGVDLGPLQTRVRAEMLRIHGALGTYDGSGVTVLTSATGTRAPGDRLTWAQVRTRASSVVGDLAVEVARFSGLVGTPPSPVALTNWRQPWVPVFLEWRVRATGSGDLAGWTLDGLDLEAAVAGGPGSEVTRELTGRSPINAGVGAALTAGIARLLDSERKRAKGDPGVLDPAQEGDLGDLAALLGPLEAVSASLDGIREQLLGIDYVGHIVRPPTGEGQRLVPASGAAHPLFGGTLEVLDLRLVDAFGRTQRVPVDELSTTLTLEADHRPATITLRPRLLHGARWLFRLVEPAFALDSDVTTAAEAYVDQLHPELAVNPVSGFLLPDHIDEALEVFDRDGNPLGQVIHDGVTDAVTWEPSPGRPVPPDAGPLDAIPAHAQHAALIAAGLVRQDVANRAAGATVAETDTTLSALLRAVDSTLWSVDTYAAVGSPSIAGLVGRPIAVVRATLRLETPDDLGEVAVPTAAGVEARRAAFARLSEQRFPVRLGDLNRSDDAVLGFFVGDDYTRFHVVDRVVAAQALASGRHRGHLGVLGHTDFPATSPLVNAYIEAEDTLLLRPGETVALTVLMLPAGKLHLTSGVLPQKSIALADEWVTRGLRALMPSMRVGPVVVDPGEIRMPTVHAFGDNQRFTRRTGPLTWRDDPILASTTAAYLPRMPHELQEGWIRIGEGTEEGAP